LSWAIDLVAKRGDAIRCLRFWVCKDDYWRLACRLRCARTGKPSYCLTV